MFKGYTLEDILSFDDFIEYMGISRSLGYKLLATREVKGIKVGKVWKIPRNTIEEYINNKLKRF